MRVVLHIGRLVLRGTAPADRDRMATDLRAELARLLADPAAAERLAALPHAAVLRMADQGGGPGHPGHQLPGRGHSASGAEPARGGVSAARAIAKGLVR